MGARAPSRPGLFGSNDLSFVLAIGVISVCCLAIEMYAPVEWRPQSIWLVLAPGLGLLYGAIPAILTRAKAQRAERRSQEQSEIISLLLKDYAADRGDWMWSTDPEGKLRGVNAKFAGQVGEPIGRLERLDFAELLTARLKADPRTLRDITTAMRQRQPFYDIEAALTVKDAARRWRLAGKPIFREGRFAGFIGTASDITDEARARETISFLAYNDGMTGLANRSHFTKRLDECVARLERSGRPFTVLYLDLDKFKAVNDSRGHHAGDRLLVEVGARLGAMLRDTDLVARLGGDEFSVILDDECDPDRIAQMASRLIAEIGRPYEIEGDELVIGLSVGIAIAPMNGTRPDQILRNADLALYRAKEEGGNRLCFFESRMDSELRERRLLEIELSEALDRGEFELYYQPLVSAVDGTIAGLEALIRWNHPIRGLVPPNEFIPIAERSTLIGRIGEWTIAEACRMLSRLPDRYSVAVNLSTKHFRTADIPSLVGEAVREAGVSPGRLEIEITESLLIEDPDEMTRKLRELRRAGITVAMDDFGTGYSSLSYLLKFPFDKIKIDRSFVSASSEDNVAKEILRAIVSLSTTLEIKVTAEGVETQEQADFLRETGCHLLQGYYFARPMPAAHLAAHFGLPIEFETIVPRKRMATGRGDAA